MFASKRALNVLLTVSSGIIVIKLRRQTTSCMCVVDPPHWDALQECSGDTEVLPAAWFHSLSAVSRGCQRRTLAQTLNMTGAPRWRYGSVLSAALSSPQALHSVLCDAASRY
jgi:hypothetical protein